MAPILSEAHGWYAGFVRIGGFLMTARFRAVGGGLLRGTAGNSYYFLDVSALCCDWS